MVFILQAIVFERARKEKFHLEWNEEKDALLTSTPLFDSDKLRVREATAKELFDAQMEAFYKKSHCLLFVQIILCASGHFAVNHQSFLGCSDDGMEWVFQTVYGDIFGKLYMVMVLMEILTAEIVMYGIPKKYGWFDQMRDKFRNMNKEN
jgi:hypothetical protein